MGALSVLSALVMATQERTREIGIFASIGWSGARIMTSIVLEGMLMCAIGCVLGVLLSFLAAFGFPHMPAIGNLISFKPSVALIAPVLGAARNERARPRSTASCRPPERRRSPQLGP
jgi:ABC-type antimicrobial peptide transport system permease subunit